MSTAILETPHWLDVIGLPTHADPVAELMLCVLGQTEQAQLPMDGWWTTECVDCGAIETDESSLSEFGETLERIGWAADSLKRFTVFCPKCINAPDTAHYAAQYQEGSGGLL